jgi:hypothetical protein
VEINAADIAGATAGIESSGDIMVNAAGSVAVERLLAGDDIRIAGALSVDLGRAEATGVGPDNEEDGANIIVAAANSIALATGIAATDIRLTSETGTVRQRSLAECRARSPGQGRRRHQPWSTPAPAATSACAAAMSR